MIRGTEIRLWLAAGAVSLAVHGVLAAGLGIGPDRSMEAGGNATSFATLGDADFDAVLAGELTRQTAPQLMPETGTAEQANIGGSSMIEPDNNSEPMASLQPEAILEPQQLQATEPVSSPIAPIPAEPAEPEQAAEPREFVLPQSVPVPVRRPDHAPPAGESRSGHRAEKPASPAGSGSTASRKEPRREAAPRSGAGGEQATNARRGSASPANSGASSSTTAGRASDAIGNARLTNYAGMIRRKIKARFRPSGTGSGSRDVVVSFTVRNNGSASSLRVSRSSGNAALDNAALAAVKAAAPFPPLPGGRSSLSVAVPLNVN